MNFPYKTRKGSGNCKFPESNPQAEFISAEENSASPATQARICLFICQTSLKTPFSTNYISGSRRRRKSSSWDRSHQPVQVLRLSVSL